MFSFLKNFKNLKFFIREFERDKLGNLIKKVIKDMEFFVKSRKEFFLV